MGTGAVHLLILRGATMANDPISRLEVVQREIDRVFGAGYAAAHPDVVAAVVQSAASDWAAARLALAIERVAEALLVEEAESNPGHPEVIVRARELVRP
jgi:hypothetical protein